MVDCGNFLIGKYPVTQEQYRKVLGKNPSDSKGKKNPVESISWYDAIEFCNALSLKEGLTPCYVVHSENGNVEWNQESNGYRLPTISEWEYAARGGNKSRGFLYSGSNTVNDVAWHYINSDNKLHTVGEKKPNELGIHDMSGNVWEWCWGIYHNRNFDHVLCGGGWNTSALFGRIDIRRLAPPDFKSNSIGFRLTKIKVQNKTN